MDLKGAQIQNILNLCKEMNSTETKPLRVNIPHYQRPYKWGETQIRNLITDFYKNSSDKKEDAEYFVGSVVLVKNDHSGDEWQDVIDGQQRITTVFLLNYLRFLLLRAHIEDLITDRNPAKIGKYIGKLKECYVQLLGSNKKSNIFDDMEDSISEMIDDAEKADEESDPWDQILSCYQEAVGLPPRDFSDEDQYKEEYCKKLSHFLNNDDLALRYSRTSYNEKLKTALSMVCLRSSSDYRPNIITQNNSIDTDPILTQYISAMHFAFDALCSKALSSEVSTPNKAAECLIDAIQKMIESLKFCVIMTGNERDAYTLFEVLNDRSMEVDDLDLIKNLFLKEYCDHSGESEIDIDKTIESIDSLWGEKIFAPGSVSSTRAKSISYLATIYLTADENLYANKAEKYRETIDEQHLSMHFQDKKYTSLDIKKDIAVFQMIGMLFEMYQIPANKKCVAAIKAENDASSSITYRTLHLLNALEQDGVIAALTNLILGSYIRHNDDFDKNGLDEKEFQKYLRRLKEDKKHSDPEFAEIHKWAFEIWKATLLAEDYSIPRDIARSLISLVSFSKFDIHLMNITSQQAEALKNEFISWTSKWQYGNLKKNLKVKILFIELFHTSKTESTITYDVTYVNLNTEEIVLDHLDAKNPDSAWLKYYYKPDDPNTIRDREINGLGNFMILDQEGNNSKANKPLDNALVEFYSSFKDNGVWLIKEIEETLDSPACHEKVPYGGKNIRVPNDHFFAARTKSLQQSFYTILHRECLTDTELKIQAI